MHKYEELENRWKRYRMKQVVKLYLFPGLIVFGGFLLYFLAFQAMHGEGSQEIAEATQSAEETDARVAETKVTTQTASQADTAEVTPKNQQTSEAQQAPAPDTPEQSIVTPAPVKEKPSTVPMTQSVQETSVQCYMVNVPVLNIREKPFIGAPILDQYRQNDVVCAFEKNQGWIRGEFGWVYAKNLVEVDQQSQIVPKSIDVPEFSQTSEANPQIQETQTSPVPLSLSALFSEAPKEVEKPEISISKKSVNRDEKIALLMEKFETSKKADYALELSELYYGQNAYNDSLKWAYTANGIDPKREGAWILFAKSIYKLGQPEKAEQALEGYLNQHSDSDEIRSVLIRMRQRIFE